VNVLIADVLPSLSKNAFSFIVTKGGGWVTTLLKHRSHHCLSSFALLNKTRIFNYRNKRKQLILCWQTSWLISTEEDEIEHLLLGKSKLFVSPRRNTMCVASLHKMSVLLYKTRLKLYIVLTKTDSPLGNAFIWVFCRYLIHSVAFCL